MKLEFTAILAQRATAITLDGNGDGGKATIEFSKQFVNNLIELQKAAGKQIKFTAEFNEFES